MSCPVTVACDFLMFLSVGGTLFECGLGSSFACVECREKGERGGKKCSGIPSMAIGAPVLMQLDVAPDIIRPKIWTEYGLLGEQGKGIITSCYREQIQSAEHSKDVEKSLW